MYLLISLFKTDKISSFISYLISSGFMKKGRGHKLWNIRVQSAQMKHTFLNFQTIGDPSFHLGGGRGPRNQAEKAIGLSFLSKKNSSWILVFHLKFCLFRCFFFGHCLSCKTILYIVQCITSLLEVVFYRLFEEKYGIAFVRRSTVEVGLGGQFCGRFRLLGIQKY